MFIGVSLLTLADEASENLKEADQSVERREPTEAVLSGPSRYAGAYVESYIEARAAKFSIKDREVGPFGLLQDPTAEPPKRKLLPQKRVSRPAALPPTPLADMVQLIRVNTVMPGERKFLVGTRSFSKGDEFPLVFQGKKVPVRITEVSSAQIRFMNVETKEQAALKLGLLPAGMAAASGGSLKPPGMIIESAEQPLTLDSGPGPNVQN